MEHVNLQPSQAEDLLRHVAVARLRGGLSAGGSWRGHGFPVRYANATYLVTPKHLLEGSQSEQLSWVATASIGQEFDTSLSGWSQADCDLAAVEVDLGPWRDPIWNATQGCMNVPSADCSFVILTTGNALPKPIQKDAELIKGSKQVGDSSYPGEFVLEFKSLPGETGLSGSPVFASYSDGLYFAGLVTAILEPVNGAGSVFSGGSYCAVLDAPTIIQFLAGL